MEKMICINQKAYLNSIEENNKFQKELSNYKDQLIVFPSMLYIKEYQKNNFIVGAQNISDEKEGAHTAEITAKSLRDIGVKYALIGHSEIRKKYKDEENYINKKIEKALENNLTPILCITKVTEDLKNIPRKTIISYEPTWAIGTNKTPTKEEIEQISEKIKSLGFKKVLYGGSVNEDTIEMLSKIENLDGFLIGGCTLKTSSIIKIIEVVSE